MAKYKRKNYLINKPLQFAYMGIAIWLLLVSVLLIGTLTYYITLNTVLAQLESTQNLNIDAYQIVKTINSILSKRIGGLLVFLIILAGILEMFYLHRIAGPIYRIEKTLRDTAEGKKFIPIKLREKDFFKGLAEAANNFMELKKGEKTKEPLEET